MTVCFGHLDFGNLNLPFDLAQGGESFDFAQDREPVERPVERLVEPFRAWDLEFRILPFYCQDNSIQATVILNYPIAFIVLAIFH